MSTYFLRAVGGYLVAVSPYGHPETQKITSRPETMRKIMALNPEVRAEKCSARNG